MRVKVGSTWYAVEAGQPIMIELTDQDKECIQGMAPGANYYGAFPDGDPSYTTEEDKIRWMQS